MTESGKRVPFDPEAITLVTQHAIPHCGVIGLEVREVDETSVTMALPYNAELVGDPRSGVLHGGAITTLIDSVSGVSVYVGLGAFAPIATLDLRIDYLRPATPHEELLARAECYKVTRQIAFVRAVAHHGDASDPVAHSVSTFMIDSSNTKPLVAMIAERLANDPEGPGK